uniref:Uncharacterized protein n=1 Tax=Panagrolaimus sp. JU765 TaxID=591449 RepID=A0AC34R836_9BILA
MIEYGDRSVDDAVLILNRGSKGKTRKLDEKKRKQLSQLFFENIAEIICEIPESAEKKITITKIDVPKMFTEIKIYWKAFGNTKDIEIKEFLEENSGFIRQKLGESLFHSNVPKLNFLADREHLLLDEMNQLFAVADYGIQYRALSKTGQVLGSQKDTGAVTEEKVQKIPRFLLAKKKKMEAKKLQESSC